MSEGIHERRLYEARREAHQILNVIEAARAFVTLINRRINDTHGKWDLPRDLNEPRITLSNAIAALDRKIPDGSET